VAVTLGGDGLAWAAAERAAPADTTRVRDGVAAIRDDLAPLIRAAQERFQIPAMSVVLVRGNEVLWAQGFGLADVAKQRAATPATVYRAGSLGKPLTAIGVMQLAEKGRIDIDAPLAGYLPAFSIRSRFDTTAEPITVRSVLCHHAGLPTDLNKGMWTEQPLTAVATQLREEYAAFPPNLVFSYSNIGYTLLGHLTQQVSGLPYARYMEQRVLRPLGMSDSAFGSRSEANGDLAKGYRDGRELALLPIRDLPAAGLQTSAADLGRFMQAMLSGKAADGRDFLRRATLKEILDPQNKDVALDLEVMVGLGWFLEQDSIPGGGVVVRHGGTTLGFSAELILLPEKGLGVAVLANGDGSRDVTAQLAEEILTRTLAVKPAPLAAEGFLGKIEKRRIDYRPAEPEGNYATDFGLISIRPKDAKLCACIVEETFDLIPYPNGWFGVGQDATRTLSPSLRPLVELRFRTQRIDGREVVVAEKAASKFCLAKRCPPRRCRKSGGNGSAATNCSTRTQAFPSPSPRSSWAMASSA